MSHVQDKLRTARRGALGFTVVALVLTAATAFLLSRMIGGSRYAGEPMHDVVVAATELPASGAVAPGDLKVVQWPASAVPDGSFTTVEALLGSGPKVPVTAILAGEPVLRARLASAEAGTAMASLVPRGMRGFPVPVESWFAKARLVYPGAVVDVISTLRDPIDRSTHTKLVLQNIPVLAVDGQVDAATASRSGDPARGRDEDAVVTLLVTPDQGERLALASREGKVDLMLRNAGDEDTVPTDGTDPSALLETHQEPMALAVAEPEVRRAPPRRARPRIEFDRPVRRSAGGDERSGIKTIRLRAK